MNIIISGASKGIGYELAVQAAQNGHTVLALARNEQKLQELSQKEPSITAIAADVGNEEELQPVLNWLKENGKVDLLINNAGQLINKPFLETTSIDFVSQFESNVLTAVNLIKFTTPYIKEGGHIVNITSMGGYQGSSKYNGLSAYSTSKGALSILTECLASELAEMKVSCNALALGAVQTEMLEKAFPGFNAPVTASKMASYILGFGLTGHQYYNGQILPVTIGNP